MYKPSRKPLAVLTLAFVVAAILVLALAGIAAADPGQTEFCSNCHTGAGTAPTVTVASQTATLVTYNVHQTSSNWAAYDLSDTLKRVAGANTADDTFTAPVGHLIRVCSSDGIATGTYTQGWALIPKVLGTTPHGMITPATGVGVAPNGGQTFTFTAETGYHVSDVKIDGVSNAAAVAAGSYAFSNVTADHTVQVTFAANGFVIKSTAGAGGTISPLGDTTVAQGAEQKYTITPNAGYAVATLTVDDVAKTPTTSYTFTNVTAAHTIDVRFKTAKPTVSLALSGLKSGKLTLGKKVTSTGVLKPARAAKATLTFYRKVGTKWVKVTAKSVAVNGGTGRFTYAYKPTKKGSWRVQAVVAASSGWTKATSAYKTFTVK